jgi:hypothetical protein
MSSDPTGAMDAYNMLDFMNFQIEQFLFWVNGKPSTRINERLTFWADRTTTGGKVYAYYGFDGPDGKVRSQNISAGTFNKIKDSLGSATNPVKP